MNNEGEIRELLLGTLTSWGALALMAFVLYAAIRVLAWIL